MPGLTCACFSVLLPLPGSSPVCTPSPHQDTSWFPEGCSLRRPWPQPSRHRRAEGGWGLPLVSQAAVGICHLGQPTTGSISLSGHLSVRALPRGQGDLALSFLAPLGARRQEPSPLTAAGGLRLPCSLQEWTSAVCVYVSLRVRAYMCGRVCCTQGRKPVSSGAQL